MLSLNEFLLTGELGGIRLGQRQAEVLAALGEPTDASVKNNPLILRFGVVEVVLTRRDGSPLLVRQISVVAHRELPLPVLGPPFSDWDGRQIADYDLKNRLEGINLTPVDSDSTPDGEVLTLPSGVKVTLDSHFVRTIVFNGAYLERIVISMDPTTVAEAQAQSTQILAEAELAVAAGLTRGAILTAWSAMEVVLKALAGRTTPTGGRSPALLLRHLRARDLITEEDFKRIEKLRQLRSMTAHGVMTRPPSESEARELLDAVRAAAVKLSQ